MVAFKRFDSGVLQAPGTTPAERIERDDRSEHRGAPPVSMPSSAPATYPPGTVIRERYRIEEVLGIGGFGAVYKCTQLNMNQAVAVKVLRREHITSEEHVKRFEREAKAASKLRHPNTISIFDFGAHDDGALFLAMEFLEGETLADRLDSGQMLGAEKLVHIMTQVCHSLTEAHEAALVHRDLKPENIMLISVAGDPDYVKVLDFGIAKLADEFSAHEEKLTEMGMIMGTPAYMSPEQAYGKTLDPRSDVYALGVLMYEGLTGRVPFEGDKPMEVLVKHINNPPAKPTLVAPDLKIPLALERVVLQCLEKQPDDRPQNTRQLADQLQKALKTPDDALRKGKAEHQPVANSDPNDAKTAHVKGLEHATQGMALGGATSASGNLAGATRASGAAVIAQGGGRNNNALWLGLAAFAVVGIVAVAIAQLLLPPPADKTPATRSEPVMRAVKKPSGQGARSAVTHAAGAQAAPVPAAAPVAAAKPAAKPKPAAEASDTPKPAKAGATGAAVEPGAAPAGKAKPAVVENRKPAQVGKGTKSTAKRTNSGSKPSTGTKKRARSGNAKAGANGSVAKPGTKPTVEKPATDDPKGSSSGSSDDDFRLDDP